MEQNFDETKGDYKYIFEEERRKEKSEVLPEPEKMQIKVSWFNRFWNFILLLLFQKSSKYRKVNALVPLFIPLYC